MRESAASQRHENIAAPNFAARVAAISTLPLTRLCPFSLRMTALYDARDDLIR